MCYIDPQASRAARLLGVDYADAVIGFEFKGRQGNPVIRGIVTAIEHQPAIAAVIQGFRDEEVNALAAAQSYECLQLWKRFLIALRVHERIGEYDVEGDDEDEDGKDNLRRDLRNIQAENEEDENSDDEGGGGRGGRFFPDRFAEGIAQPTAGHIPGVTSSAIDPEVTHSGGGGFMMDDQNQDAEQAYRENELRQLPVEPDYGDSISLAYRRYVDPNRSEVVEEEEVGGGGFLAEPEIEPDPGLVLEEAGDGGGFVPELDSAPAVEKEDKEGGGGFLPEDTIPADPYKDNHNGERPDAAVRLEYLISTSRRNDTQEMGNQLGNRDVAAEGLNDLALHAAAGDGENDENEHQDDEKDEENEEEEEDEKTSLISHDPEDEDAEMEWLVSD